MLITTEFVMNFKEKQQHYIIVFFYIQLQPLNILY